MIVERALAAPSAGRSRVDARGAFWLCPDNEREMLYNYFRGEMSQTHCTSRARPRRKKEDEEGKCVRAIIACNESRYPLIQKSTFILIDTLV